MPSPEDAVAAAAWSLLAAANGLTDAVPEARTDGRPSVMRDRIDGEDGRLLRQAGHGTLLDALIAAHQDPVERAAQIPNLMEALADLAGVEAAQVTQMALESEPHAGVVAGADAVAAALAGRIQAHSHHYDLSALTGGRDDAVTELSGRLCGAVSEECEDCTDLLVGMCASTRRPSMRSST